MRVNVTYSVDLKEVRQIVEELLLKAENNIEELAQIFPTIQDFLQNQDEKRAAETIESCRKSLSTAAFSLFDCQNILNGYQQALLQARQPSLVDEEEDENESRA